MQTHRIHWLLLAFLLAPSVLSDARAFDLYGHAWNNRDEAWTHFPVELAEGSLTPSGDYYVRFCRHTDSAPSYETANFRITQGRIEPRLWSNTSFVGPTTILSDGAFAGLVCEGIVYALTDGINDPKVGTASAGSFSSTMVYQPSPIVQHVFNINIPVTVKISVAGCTDPAPPGTTDPELGSLDARFKLGPAEFGHSQGELRILSQSPRNDLCTPMLLTAVAPAPGFQVLNYEYDTNSHLSYIRQVLGPTFLLQVSHDSEDGSQFLYKINFHYLPSPLATNQDGFYAIPTNSVPFKVITVENPNGTTNYNTLLITETTDSATNQTKYVYDPAALTWTLELPGALSRHELETVSSSSTEVVERKSIYKPATPDELIYSERNRYSLLEGERLLVEQVLDPDTANLTTLFEYYTATNEFRYKRLKQKIAYDGSWEKYDYDTNYFKKVTPFNNSSTNAADSECRVLEITYATSATNPVISQVDKVLGHIVSKRFTAIYNTTNIQDIVCQDPNAGWNDTNNLVTITKTYDINHAFKYRLASIKHPDGTVAIYTYSTNGMELTTTISEGQPSAVQTNIVEEGTQTVTVVGAIGEMKSRTVYPIIASNVDTNKVLAREIYTYSGDDAFKLTPTIEYLDGRTNSGTQCSCAAAGPESTTDKDDTTTYYTYDALRRLNSSKTLDITTTNLLDAMGRSLETIRIGTNRIPMTLRKTTFDVAGRVRWQVSALNGTNTFTEGVDGSGYFVRTNTYPDGATRIETYLREKELKEIGGTAVHPVRYEYGVEYAGTNSSGVSLTNYFVKEIRLTSTGGTSEWTKTYYDVVGRPWKTVYAGASAPTRKNFYNYKGQLIKQIDPDGVTILYQYNGKGELEYTVLDVDRDSGIGASGTDRIAWTTNDVVSNYGTTVRRMRTYVWGTDGVN